MPDKTFYSDRAGQPKPRVGEEITMQAWRGLAALVGARVRDGSLARAFPRHDCVDGPGHITGTDEAMFYDSLAAHVPALTVPLDSSEPPGTATALDLVDFVAHHIDQPSSSVFHGYFGHQHLAFAMHDAEPPFGTRLTPGQLKFREDVDLLFARNGIAFTVGTDMLVHRLGPPEARSLVSDFRPRTGDPQLDAKLNDAMSRFLSRAESDHGDAIEKLWDAFERLKTLELGGQKKNSVAVLLEKVAPESFRTELETEFRAMTQLGNNFAIRHHEHGTHEIPNSAVGDYLFIRLAALIALVLRRTDRMDH